MKKIIKITTSILLAIIAFVASISNVNAAANTISIGKAIPVDIRYIAKRTFSYKVTTDGRYLYCLEEPKERVSNVTAYLVENSTLVDGGVLYIMKNGFPEKSITGDKNKDYYITQNAIWWYLDIIHGTSNVDEAFKSTGQDSYNMRKYVKNLVNSAVAHKNDSTKVTPASLTIASVNSTDLVLEGNNYISDSIKATSHSNITEYTVTITNPLNNMVIIPSNGNEFTYTGSFKVGVNDSFKIKVPVSSVNSDTTLNIEATANGSNIYEAYEYAPSNSKMQRVALLEKKETTTKATTKLNISTMQLSINKIDANTNKPLAGAVLVLKDSNNKELAKWTTTVNAHIIKNLPEGTYTVEEVEAPYGYILNKTPVTIKVTNNKRSYSVTMKNTPKNIVININKLDADTKKPLEGAVLVIKDSDGKVFARFVTESTPHVITDIPYGTYTVEEESAPSGYIKSNEKISFTVNDNQQSHQITITNTKETPVPNTGSESIIFILIGTIIVGIGLDFILKHAKA